MKHHHTGLAEIDYLSQIDPKELYEWSRYLLDKDFSTAQVEELEK